MTMAEHVLAYTTLFMQMYVMLFTYRIGGGLC